MEGWSPQFQHGGNIPTWTLPDVTSQTDTTLDHSILEMEPVSILGVGVEDTISVLGGHHVSVGDGGTMASIGGWGELKIQSVIFSEYLFGFHSDHGCPSS